ncbi:MAG: transcriptional regulator [Myxococcales bacterium]|nr:transcriptional regulator [Myxococcales bacterium]
MGYAAAEVEVTPMSRLFKALGDEVRLRIVALLSHGELCVCHIEEALELTQTNTSRHLAILRAAAVVAHQRRDKWVYYRLARQQDLECRQHMKLLVRSFTRQDLLRKDVARLLRVRGPGSCR